MTNDITALDALPEQRQSTRADVDQMYCAWTCLETWVTGCLNDYSIKWPWP